MDFYLRNFTGETLTVLIELDDRMYECVEFRKGPLKHSLGPKSYHAFDMLDHAVADNGAVTFELPPRSTVYLGDYRFDFPYRRLTVRGEGRELVVDEQNYRTRLARRGSLFGLGLEFATLDIP